MRGGIRALAGVLCAIIAFAISGVAQCPSDQRAHVLSVYALQDGKDVWVGFYSGTDEVTRKYWIAASHDGGESWGCFPVEQPPMNMFFIGPDEGWAVFWNRQYGIKSQDKVSMTRDGGRTWVPGATLESTDKWLAANSIRNLVTTSISFIGAEHGIVTANGDGGQGLIFQTEDSGKTFKLVAKNLTDSLIGGSVAAGSSLWLFGSELIASSDDGGKTWSARFRRQSEGVAEINRGIVTPNGVIWAVAGTRILHSSDAGHSWSFTKRLKSINFLSDIYFWNDAAGCAVGPSSGGVFVCTRDGGVTWQEKRLPSPTSSKENLMEYVHRGAFTEIRIAPNGNGWLYDQAGILYRTADFGHTWREFSF